MSKNDTETIVKEFLELWQKQCAYMTRDGDSVSQTLSAFQTMQESYLNSINMGLKAKENAESAATADIFRNISHEFVKLAAGYAKLEERVARLESINSSTDQFSSRPCGSAAAMAGTAKKTTAKTRRTSRAGTTKANKP